MIDPGLREKKRWRNKQGTPITWEQMYGTLRAAQMKARAAAKRKRQPPVYRTSFMRKYNLYPKTESQKDASVLSLIQSSISKASFQTINNPFHRNEKLRLKAQRRKRFEQTYGFLYK